MDNRERDRMSQRTEPTEAGKLNRETSEREGRNSGSTAEFGQKIGQSEQLGGNQKGGSMNRDKELNQSNPNKNIGEMDKDRDVSQGGFGSSTGRSGSVGNMGGGGSDSNREDSSTPRSGNKDSNLDKSDSSSGRH